MRKYIILNPHNIPKVTQFTYFWIILYNFLKTIARSNNTSKRPNY